MSIPVRSIALVIQGGGVGAGQPPIHPSLGGSQAGITKPCSEYYFLFYLFIFKNHLRVRNLPGTRDGGMPPPYPFPICA